MSSGFRNVGLVCVTCNLAFKIPILSLQYAIDVRRRQNGHKICAPTAFHVKTVKKRTADGITAIKYSFGASITHVSIYHLGKLPPSVERVGSHEMKMIYD